MGLFSKKGVCSVCGAQSSGKDIKDGFLCKACMKKSCLDVESWKGVTVERAGEAVKAMEESDRKAALFTPDKKVGRYIHIDTRNRLWQVPSRKKVVFAYEELLRYELMENGKPIDVGQFGSLLTDFLYGGNAMEHLLKKAQAESKNSMDAIRTLRLKLHTSNPAFPEVWIKVLRDMDGIRHNSLETVMYFEILQKILKELSEEIMAGRDHESQTES